jgi:hypothetical protein
VKDGVSLFVAGKELVAVTAPSFGPAIVQVFGVDIPILALGLSMVGLFLARTIAPPPARKLTPGQEVSLTAILALILFLIVTGSLTGEPLGVGMAVVWSIGLGFSGILVIEFFGERTMAALRALLGKSQGADQGDGNG